VVQNELHQSAGSFQLPSFLALPFRTSFAVATHAIGQRRTTAHDLRLCARTRRCVRPRSKDRKTKRGIYIVCIWNHILISLQYRLKYSTLTTEMDGLTAVYCGKKCGEINGCTMRSMPSPKVGAMRKTCRRRSGFTIFGFRRAPMYCRRDKTRHTSRPCIEC
jgi:hypothetical protein